jgi:hypothetical protein
VKIKLALLTMLILLLSNCSFRQDAQIIIQNNSGFQINRFLLSYHTSSGVKNENIDSLEVNGKRILDVTIAEAYWGFGGGVYVAKFEISYYINGIYYNVSNDYDAVLDDAGNFYNNNAGLQDTRKTTITIYNDGYKIE